MRGGAPYTGAWCDDCYASLGGGIPLGRIVTVALALFTLLAALLVVL